MGEDFWDCSLNCPPYVLWEGYLGRVSRRGADVAEKISEVAFLYEDPGRHAQPHTNHKPVFAELADLVEIIFLTLYLVFN